MPAYNMLDVVHTAVVVGMSVLVMVLMFVMFVLMMFMFMFMVVLFTFGMSVYRHLHMGAGNATFHRGLGCELHPGYTQGVKRAAESMSPAAPILQSRYRVFIYGPLLLFYPIITDAGDLSM